MPREQLTSKVSKRICSHMNKDHQEAVIRYAREYGGLEKAMTAKMLSITPLAMELKVDGQIIEINFDHTLADSEDAHRTLVNMLKSPQKSN